MLAFAISVGRYSKNLYMVKPNPIIDIAVRTQAIRVRSAATIDRLMAKLVRSLARSVPVSSSGFLTSLCRSSDAGAFVMLVNISFIPSSQPRNQPTENEVGNDGQNESDDESFA